MTANVPFSVPTFGKRLGFGLGLTLGLGLGLWLVPTVVVSNLLCVGTVKRTFTRIQSTHHTVNSSQTAANLRKVADRACEWSGVAKFPAHRCAPLI